ncbi:uncharacterized protein LOC124166736 [Ischnura elegans]|uniref:uncharacterized protein LOC124166736 n=1 Tax=Ischnura elegans TaxID=197161 RepID=UPI001ED8A2B7|nr:uncharacterized protein LOC124166736 [Ischnura elegans]XP_046400361.1 uncharacterized protein LOC124166736 [Ischnura elegans]
MEVFITDDESRKKSSHESVPELTTIFHEDKILKLLRCQDWKYKYQLSPRKAQHLLFVEGCCQGANDDDVDSHGSIKRHVIDWTGVQGADIRSPSPLYSSDEYLETIIEEYEDFQISPRTEDDDPYWKRSGYGL